MNFLIVVPRYYAGAYEFYHFPMGLAYVSAMLKRAGHQVDVLNLNDYHHAITHNDYLPLRALLNRKLAARSYDALCTGGISSFYDGIKKIVEIAKGIDPELTVILGGGSVSSEPTFMLERTKADFGVVGEGEETIVELVREIEGAQNFADVTGLVWRSPEKGIVCNSPRKAIMDLDALPFPDYEGFEVGRYVDQQLTRDLQAWYPVDRPRYLPIITSRSCPFKCSFCFHPVGDKYRVRSLDSVFSEIEYLIEHFKINMFSTYDELFGFNREKTVEFCTRIKPYGLKWAAQVRVDKVDRSLLNLLRDSGCVYLSYGIESASDIVLDGMRKHITKAQIDNALDLTYEAGLQIQGNLIFGDRTETWETAHESLEWWLANPRYAINLGQISPYPGSALYSYALQRGLIKPEEKELYIKDACGALSTVNLTAMSDEQFRTLMAKVWSLLHEKGAIPARVVSCKFAGIDPRRGHYYSMEIECPHCHRVENYPEMHRISTSEQEGLRLRSGCKNCYQRFDTAPFELEERMLKFLNSGLRRFAVLGASDHIRQMLKSSLNFRLHVAAIIDDNLARQTRVFDGVEIFSTDSCAETLKGRVDGVLILRNYGADSAQRALTQLEQAGIRRCDMTDLVENVFFVPPNRLDWLGETAEQVNAKLVDTFNRGVEALKDGRTGEAFYTFLSIVERWPGVIDAHYALTEAALLLKDFKTALNSLYTIQLATPEDATWLNKIGVVHAIAGQLAEARTVLMQALQRKDLSEELRKEILANLIVVLTDLNVPKQAMEDLRLIKESFPNSREIEVAWSKAQELFGQVSALS